jgi:hypothetical protein
MQRILWAVVINGCILCALSPRCADFAGILAPVLRDSGKYYAAGFALSASRTPV